MNSVNSARHEGLTLNPHRYLLTQCPTEKDLKPATHLAPILGLRSPQGKTATVPQPMLAEPDPEDRSA